MGRGRGRAVRSGCLPCSDGSLEPDRADSASVDREHAAAELRSVVPEECLDIRSHGLESLEGDRLRLSVWQEGGRDGTNAPRFKILFISQDRIGRDEIECI